jgi:putative hydrolase of the HAD superfamily
MVKLPDAPRAVLLDGLGTLVELAPPWPSLVAGLRQRYGVELTLADAEAAFRVEMAYYRAHHCEGRDARSLAELRQRCAKVLHTAFPPALAAKIAVDELTPLLLAALQFVAYADASDALVQLRKRGLTLIVVSNWDISLHDVLRATGLFHLLDGVITSAEVGRPKPAPEIFHAALELAGVPAMHAIHVGDSLEHDIAGARAARIAPVLLRRASGEAGGTGDASESSHVPGDVPVISSLAELPGLVLSSCR